MKSILGIIGVLFGLIFFVSCSNSDNTGKDYKIKYVIYYTENHLDTVENVYHSRYDYPELISHYGSNQIMFVEPRVQSTAPIQILSIEEVTPKKNNGDSTK